MFFLEGMKGLGLRCWRDVIILLATGIFVLAAIEKEFLILSKNRKGRNAATLLEIDLVAERGGFEPPVQ